MMFVDLGAVFSRVTLCSPHDLFSQWSGGVGGVEDPEENTVFLHVECGFTMKMRSINQNQERENVFLKLILIGIWDASLIFAQYYRFKPRRLVI